MLRAAVCLAICLGAAGTIEGADSPPLVASRGDAFVAHQNGSDVWSIGSANLEVTIGFDASRTLALQRLFNPSTGRTWDITPGPDLTLTANGERVALTSSGAVTFVSATALANEHGV